jgi:hypothetical protein
LGLTDSDFWSLTLIEFNALLRRQSAEYERDSYHAALICAVTLNSQGGRGKGKKPYSPQDFMPKLTDREPKKKQQGWREMKQMAKMLNRVFRGVEVERNG